VVPEHVILGLIREGEGVALMVLRDLGVDLAELNVAVESAVLSRFGLQTISSPAMDNSELVRALELSAADAKSRQHTLVGTEHLLMGIVASPGSPAAMLLSERGVGANAARAVTARLPGSDPRGHP
jgi:ATP-dependent Clp protease ATP-binding subunit ClpC